MGRAVAFGHIRWSADDSAMSDQAPKVVAKVVGGLGNQLFCYAAARSVAERVGAQLVLDVDFFRSDVRYGRQYRLDRFALAPHGLQSSRRWLPPSMDLGWWRIRRKIAKLGLVPGVSSIVERDSKRFYPELLSLDVRGTLHLDGYWQDERYFRRIRPLLLTELAPAAPIDARNRSVGQEMCRSGSVAIHCRRHHHRLADGSIQQARGRPGLDENYYRAALDTLSAAGTVEHLYLFGDEPQWLLNALPSGLPRTLVDWNAGAGGEVLDMWLMTQCRYSVVSNSTLSWWGAWLRAETAGRVVAPAPQDLEYWVPNSADWVEISW